MKQITEYDIKDHGADHEQYFQGHSVSCTIWDECVTGAGVTAYEALEDCLEQLALEDFDVDSIENGFPEHAKPESREDFYHYVSIDYKTLEETK